MTLTTLTTFEATVLGVLYAHGGSMRPREVARAVWPAAHPGWRKSHKCGVKGNHPGMGMYTAMGGALGRLRRRGLVAGGFWPEGYYLTLLGCRVLRCHVVAACGVRGTGRYYGPSVFPSKEPADGSIRRWRRVWPLVDPAAVSRTGRP